ncbi:MAG: cytochrome c5 family protein, partial [Desulfuromonadales bacterium]|nr:cytochrome c5 family protein [Desulfuromonadales bacterium]
VCATCHREGIAGAPGIENRELWQERLAKGMPALIENSINGFQGNLGVMPPKGGAQSLTDEQVASAVAYMVEQVPQQ